MLSFPYQLDATGDLFPVIPISVTSGNQRQEIFALIDSGAAISVFQSEIADVLGIDILKGKQVFLGGITGRIRGYIHNLEIEVGKIKLFCPVVFSKEYVASFNLLGREKFFEKFRITFAEKKKRVELE